MILNRLLEALTLSNRERLMHVQQALIEGLPDEFDVVVSHGGLDHLQRETPPILLITGGWIDRVERNHPPIHDRDVYALIVRVPPPSSTSVISVTRPTSLLSKRYELEFDFPNELRIMIKCIYHNEFAFFRDREV